MKLYCSFCFQNEDQAKVLVMAPHDDICICDNCVGICVDLLSTRAADAEYESWFVRAGVQA